MIELTQNQIDIMGRPNFACAKVAKLLMVAGAYSKGPKKAEYEQAVYIHWALDLMARHGDEWRTFGEEILRGYADKLASNSH